jgi:hypothetical protein
VIEVGGVQVTPTPTIAVAGAVVTPTAAPVSVEVLGETIRNLEERRAEGSNAPGVPPVQLPAVPGD